MHQKRLLANACGLIGKSTVYSKIQYIPMGQRCCTVLYSTELCSRKNEENNRIILLASFRGRVCRNSGHERASRGIENVSYLRGAPEGVALEELISGGRQLRVLVVQ